MDVFAVRVSGFLECLPEFGVEGCKSVSLCGHQSLMREIFRMCSRALPTSVNRIPDCLFDVGHNFIAFFSG